MSTREPVPPCYQIPGTGIFAYCFPEGMFYMQVFGLDDEGRTVSARSAKKTVSYFCPECKGELRLRGGLHRQDHFYHLNRTADCRHEGKSFVHLNTQERLLRALPEGEAELELHFPEISRIADVAWKTKKIIFEVQCSFIREEEVRQRNRDYGSLGYTVVWLLSDSRFNHKRLTAAERFLIQEPHYFFRWNQDRPIFFYDQQQWIEGVVRERQGRKLPVNLTSPIWKNSLLYFQGDHMDQYGSRSHQNINKKFINNWRGTKIYYFARLLWDAPKAIGHWLLESSSARRSSGG